MVRGFDNILNWVGSWDAWEWRSLERTSAIRYPYRLRLSFGKGLYGRGRAALDALLRFPDYLHRVGSFYKSSLTFTC